MYMVVFGISQIFFSQLPNLSEMAWLSILAAVMSFSYSTIGVGLALAQTISGKRRIFPRYQCIPAFCLGACV
jgi:hypothetical protein